MDVTPEDTLVEISSKLTRMRMIAAKKLLSHYKFNINPVLGYLSAKQVEVDNLRILTRGKHANLPDELIRGQLIV